MNTRGGIDTGSGSRAKQEVDSAFRRGMDALDRVAASRATSALPPAAAAKMLNEYRARYMRGLVKFLKNDPAGAKEMYAAVTGVELAQGDPGQRGFWWVVLAFFEALIHQALPEGADARPLCNGVEQRIRRLSEAAPQGTEPQNGESLLRELLYLIVSAEPVSDRLRSVMEAFRTADNAAETARVELKVADPNSPVFRPEPPAAPRAAAAPGADDVSEFVEIAGEQVSKSLFDLFSEEARGHVATLKAEFEVTKSHGVITDAMLLAVHSLSGVAGTMHFDNLRDLSSSFARALAPLSLEPLSGDEEDLIEQSIEATERMVVEALGLAEPTPMPELIDRLEGVAARTVAEAPVMVREEEEVILPEEEAAMEREDGAAPAPVPAAPTPGAVQLDDQPAGGRPQRRMSDEVDSELMPVFLEEANRLVPSLADTLLAWQAQPAGQAHGRSLGTTLQNLKGSARMAGVMSVGELCQYMETRVEAALGYDAAPPSLIDELATSMNRMAVLFGRLQPDGGAAVEAARRVAASMAPANAGTAAGAGAAAQRQPESVAPRLEMLRVRADLIDEVVDGAAEAAAAHRRIVGEAAALRAMVAELAGSGARLRARLGQINALQDAAAPAGAGLSQALRQLAESADDVDAATEALQATLAQSDEAIAAQSALDGKLRHQLMRLRMLPLGTLAERLHRVVRRTAKELDKRANLDIHGAQVELDRSVLERVVAPLEQLLRNAVEHGIEPESARGAAGKPPIGEICIDASVSEDEVVITVSDDGAGLDLDRVRARALELNLIAGQSSLADDEIALLIFETGFCRDADAGGLAGVRAVLGAIGGSLDRRPGGGPGLAMQIRVPVTLAKLAAAAAESAPAGDARPGAGPPPLVLVVDDSLSVRRNAGRLFAAQGYRVITARDGVEALERLLEEQPSVLLVDADMPRMDGMELTRKIRANARLADMPVIMLSADDSGDRQKLASETGVDHFLVKPCQEEELLRHVSGFIAAIRNAE